MIIGLIGSFLGIERISPSTHPVHVYFTPHGILQNPYHVWPKAPSGVLRSTPVMGFEWVVGWGWNFIRAPEYIASLKIGVNIDGHSFYNAEDFIKEKVDYYSKLHSKNIISYDWQYSNLVFSFKFFLVKENSLACLVTIQNNEAKEKVITLHAIERLFSPKPYSIFGLYKPQSLILSCPALDLMLVLSSTEKSIAQKFAHTEFEIQEWIKNNDLSIIEKIEALFLAYGMISFQLKVPTKTKKEVALIIGKGKDCALITENLHKSLNEVTTILEDKIKEDQEFWSKAPKLVGDWPKHWINGFVYDFETLRTIVYPPIGIFHYPWDIMSVNWPRNVIAETSIDMLMMSYADMELAKTVLLGLYKDALAPNVPCVHADGTFNMIAEDGSKCGTSPAWCFPFYNYLLIYFRSLDKNWLKQIYPYWSSFLKWWLENRVDKEEWLHYKCSWESGEDLAPRFGYQNYGGQSIEHIRPSELQAVISHAAKTMAFYANELNLNKKEIEYWEIISQKYNQKLQEMWFKGWFHDYDIKSDKFTEYKDALHLSPIFLGLTNKNQTLKMITNIEHLLSDFQKSTSVQTLDWPSLTFPFVEALWIAGKYNPSVREYLSKQIYELIDRIYTTEDARPRVTNHPLPGISYEHWEQPQITNGGVEGYGWGALSTLLIIRHIIGYREIEFSNENSFLLSPNFEKIMIQEGKIYGIENLHFRDITFGINYSIQSPTLIEVFLRFKAKNPYAIKVTDEMGVTIYENSAKRIEGEINFQVRNGKIYKVGFII
ncbi:MAG: trehalase family glycosidase [Candidatus Methanomethylicaceae archaeon]